ncbi:MAG: OsmC family protein [Planctomycetota bacterium]|nr:OsmC family protein [Planctomycetota bacterium]
MSEHSAVIRWRRTSDDFAYSTYNREHAWEFDGGESVRASAAPAYKGDPSCVDPEEAFIASLSACHMLTFLALCTKQGLVVDSYVDEAVGRLERTEEGEMAITRVVLRPSIEFGGEGAPDEGVLAELHRDAHRHCFIARSVRTEVVVEALEDL